MTTKSSTGSKDTAAYPLYGTTFTLHRLSPLYHGSSTTLLSNAPLLNHHARRFQDILKGEVLRGVHVGLASGEEGLGKAGALVDCRWDVLKDERTWAGRKISRDEDRGVEESSKEIIEPGAKGLHLEIEYERATYTAILLRRVDAPWDEEEGEELGPAEEERREQRSREGFTSLPLLMTRMPNTLRDTLIDYLSTAFDTRCSALRLSSSFLTGSLEVYLQDLTVPRTSTTSTGATPLSRRRRSTKQPSTPATPIMKDINLILTFPPPVSPSLKTLDLVIPAAGITQFLERGRRQLKTSANQPNQLNGKRKRRQPSKSRSNDPSGTDHAPQIFTTALSTYTSTHLAMPLYTTTTTTTTTSTDPSSQADPSSIRTSRIACGGFVIGVEGKVKVFTPPASVSAVDTNNVTDDDAEDEETGVSREESVEERATRRFVEGLVARASGIEEDGSRGVTADG
ncbi:MAG: hypothetical protein M1837_005784 [Sclerophora amabilis]|nr:MAG: hypothetical protein M1837_005784 [Sclerophora amabilis]